MKNANASYYEFLASENGDGDGAGFPKKCRCVVDKLIKTNSTIRWTATEEDGVYKYLMLIWIQKCIEKPDLMTGHSDTFIRMFADLLDEGWNLVSDMPRLEDCTTNGCCPRQKQENLMPSRFCCKKYYLIMNRKLPDYEGFVPERLGPDLREDLGNHPGVPGGP